MKLRESEGETWRGKNDARLALTSAAREGGAERVLMCQAVEIDGSDRRRAGGEGSQTTGVGGWPGNEHAQTCETRARKGNTCIASNPPNAPSTGILTHVMAAPYSHPPEKRTKRRYPNDSRVLMDPTREITTGEF